MCTKHGPIAYPSGKEGHLMGENGTGEDNMGWLTGYVSEEARLPSWALPRRTEVGS